jgi:peroxiredoxin (alkyl hydroperoxide reductase subunit C)
MHVNDLPIGRNVDEALRLVEAIKFTDEHGEGKLFLSMYISFFISLTYGSFTLYAITIIVCPINWNKGGKGMNPDPKGSKVYFEATY